MTKRKDPADLKPRGFQKGGAEFRAPGGNGWGGGAKGAGSEAESIQTAPAFTGDENRSGLPGFRAMTKAQRLDACREVWWEVMTDKTEAATARIIAADKFYDREDGKAFAKNVTYTGDEFGRLSERELADEQARIDAALAESEAREAASGRPIKPDDMVH